MGEQTVVNIGVIVASFWWLSVKTYLANHCISDFNIVMLVVYLAKKEYELIFEIWIFNRKNCNFQVR